MIPIDITAVIKKGLADGHRPHDALLHASSDLVGPLRHTQLRFVGAPTVERDLVSDIRLHTGTMWHRYIGSLLVDSGVPVLQEVSVTPWLPTGWSGTADWLFYAPEYEAFVLGDLKTAKGEAMKWKEKDGMSIDHHHQISMYWHALVEAGFPMLDVVSVMYLPMNTVPGEFVAPVVIEAAPLNKEYLWELAASRYERCLEYDESFSLDLGPSNIYEYYLTDALAPPSERIQKLFKSGDKYEVKLVPHWLTAYCPFPDELCDCNTQRPEKIGEFVWGAAGEWVFNYRRGYTIDPEVFPNA